LISIICSVDDVLFLIPGQDWHDRSERLFLNKARIFGRLDDDYRGHLISWLDPGQLLAAP
jgi:hypothetical protein